MVEQQRVLSIKELNRYIRMKMESDQLLSEVWIRGEISNFTHHSSGHMYFTLKDEGSRIKCIMFASHNQRLPFVPKEGARVIARGNVTVYERDGQYQFYAVHMQPDGIGSLYLAYEQLKSKLEGEGLFAPERKRELPRYPGDRCDHLAHRGCGKRYYNYAAAALSARGSRASSRACAGQRGCSVHRTCYKDDE